MSLTTRLIRSQCAFGVAMLLLVASGGSAQMIPLEQDRSVSGFVIVPQCLAEQSMFDEARGFGPFESTAHAVADCALASAIASSKQASSIGGAQLTAMATSTSEASAVEPNVIHSIANSLYEVVFELEEPAHYLLSGILTAEISNSNEIFAGAFVSLRNADNELLLEFAVEGDPDGEPQFEALASEGVLEPGVYAFRATAFTGVDNDVPPSVTASAFYELAFQVETVCPADLDGNGHVGPEDLALLLGNWGPVDCAGLGCPDFNQDGEVDAEDLAVVLGQWGECP